MKQKSGTHLAHSTTRPNQEQRTREVKRNRKKTSPLTHMAWIKTIEFWFFRFGSVFFLSVCIKSYRLFSLLLWMWWKDKTTMKCTFKVRFDHLNKRREEEVCKGDKSVVLLKMNGIAKHCIREATQFNWVNP